MESYSAKSHFNQYTPAETKEESYHLALGEHSPGERMMDVIIGSIDESDCKLESMHFNPDDLSLSAIDFVNLKK
jgi:hypothetical protein